MSRDWLVLGAGWGSPDIFEAFSHRLPYRYDYGKLGFIVGLRGGELVRLGKKPLVAYVQDFRDRDNPYNRNWIASEFRRLRTEADRWQASSMITLSESLSESCSA